MFSIADFLFEVGFLHKTPRSGYRFLGSGNESVSEHSFRATVIAFVLGRLEPEADTQKLLMLALFHDLPEARTGDLNYVYKQYVTALSDKATDDMVRDLPFGEEIKEFIEEYERGESLEARLAHDADQLDLLLTLKMELDMGNRYAQDWIPNLLKRLQTTHGKELAQRILERDHKDWWFRGHDHWWEKK